MNFVLVHGLGLSSNIWSRLIPLLDGEVIALDMPGHGISSSTEYSWKGFWTTIMDPMKFRTWSDTTLVLHSFTASLLPEILSSGVRPRKIVLLEGILHSDDALMSNNLILMDEDQFSRWLDRFRSVSKMALKSQLVSRHTKSDIGEWSDAFNVVQGDAFYFMAINLQKRLGTNEIFDAIRSLSIPLLYIRGENSRLSFAGRAFLQQNNVKIIEISNSAHFPMIDNPKELSHLIME